MENKNYVNFPCDLVPLNNQVAGHDFKDGNNSVGLLKHADGYVLKPIHKKQPGENEIKFYNWVLSSHLNELVLLQEFLPHFMGTVSLKINGNDVQFLKLQDVTSGLDKPCIMDVKIGARTWDPNASDLKRAAEESKYAACKKAYGFCIPGYQVYNIKSGKFIKHGKELGKLLSEESVPDALREFLNYDCGLSQVLKTHFLKQLNKILDWFLKQTVIHIYASSVLLLYDANQLKNLGLNNYKLNMDCSSWINVYMIDFAHVFPAENGQLDRNYICGLQKLINLFCGL